MVRGGREGNLQPKGELMKINLIDRRVIEEMNEEHFRKWHPEPRGDRVLRRVCWFCLGAGSVLVLAQLWMAFNKF